MTLPLEGIRVLDLSMYLPGPLCSQILADFGAEVIKIEEITGEWGRWVYPLLGSDSARFYAVNRNKKSMALNLKTAKGREIFLQLVRDADVLLEQFRPGVMAKMELDYEHLKDINPRLIYCSISGYGHSGPLQYAAGHDLNYLSLAGISHLTGSSDKPAMSGVQIADIGGGSLQAVSSILLALLARGKTGRGQFCDIAMLDGAVSMLVYSLGEWSGAGRLPFRGEEILTGGFASYQIYQTADGKYVSLGAIEAKFWKGFCEKIGRADFIPCQWDSDKQEEMITAIQAIMAGKTQEEWVEFFASEDICFTPVLTLEEMSQHPQIEDRNMAIVLENFQDSGKNLVLAGIPIKLSETPGRLTLSFPKLGEHTAEILQNLGYSEEEILKLKTDKIIAQDES